MIYKLTTIFVGLDVLLLFSFFLHAQNWTARLNVDHFSVFYQLEGHFYHYENVIVNIVAVIWKHCMSKTSFCILILEQFSW